jgi:deoxyribose-phosphate aldolase
MVLNIGALKSGDRALVQKDIQAVVHVAKPRGATVKVILETAHLSDMEKAIACELALAAGADFVKTSTGFGPAGATARDVALLKRCVDGLMGVKAAGGIRTLQEVIEMVQAGASRIGTSAGVRIMEELAGSA